MVHDNPFRRFVLGLLQLSRIQEACSYFYQAGSNPNLLLFALWTAQQQLRLAPAFTQDFPQLGNWYRDYTQPLRRQQRDLRLLADVMDQASTGPMHRMQQLLSEALTLAEQQEHAILYYHYQQRQGLLPCESRQMALLENLLLCLGDLPQPESKPLAALLNVVLEDEQIEPVIATLSQHLARRHSEE